jgi:hypothetical protein
MTEISFSIQYKASDFQKGYEAHFSQNFLKYYFGYILGIVPLGLGLYMKYLVINANDFLATWMILFGAIMIPYIYWKLKSAGRRVFNKLPEYYKSILFKISDQGVESSNPKTSTRYDWGGFVRVVIKKDLILLYPNEFSFHILLKEYIKDDEFDQLINLVKEKVADCRDKR